jgi:hypothetical protein
MRNPEDANTPIGPKTNESMKDSIGGGFVQKAVLIAAIVFVTYKLLK